MNGHIRSRDTRGRALAQFRIMFTARAARRIGVARRGRARFAPKDRKEND